jgi:OmpA-OmpF porin, OOP family
MLMWKQRALLVGLAASCAPAFAADEVGQWYFGPQAGFTFADSDRQVDDAAHFGAVLGKHFSPNWSLELNALGSNHDFEVGNQDVDLLPVSLDLLRVFNRGAPVAPYLSLGAGALSVDPQGPGSNEDFMAQAGFGLLWRVWENSSGSSTFSLRPEVKARWAESGREDPVDYLAGIGFVYAHGAEKAPPPAPPPPPPPPEPAAAAPAPPPPPPPPSDTDGDGVTDDRDRCPGTPRGVAVDADGCPRKGSITLTGVNFETNSATLTADSSSALDAVAADLMKYPRLKIEVEGHTDSVGADGYNLKLSERRANSVREYLVGRGVDAAQLTARGYGEARPEADNASAEGRAQNRRVAMQVLENPGDVKVKNE